MDHDRLFKAVLQEYFQNFLQLFFPDLEARLDFETLLFQDKELFTNLPQGIRREVDIVAKIESYKQSPEVVLVHIEIESDWNRAFAERMYEYHSMLWLLYRAPVVPIVVYLRGGREGLTEEEYRLSHPVKEYMHFSYYSIRLAKRDAGEYLMKGTPLAAALAALMDRRKVREPLILRASMLKQVEESEGNDAQKFLLLHVIDSYFTLTAGQKKNFSNLLLNKEYREVRKMVVTWADEIAEKARAEGLEKGRQTGLISGKREAVLKLLTTKFGPLPEHATLRLHAMESLDDLDACLDRVLTAKSLEEMGL